MTTSVIVWTEPLVTMDLWGNPAIQANASARTAVKLPLSRVVSEKTRALPVRHVVVLSKTRQMPSSCSLPPPLSPGVREMI